MPYHLAGHSSCLRAGYFPIISKEDCEKALRGLDLPGNEVLISNEDRGQEGCYMEKGKVFMPAPPVLAEHGDRNENASWGMRPICYLPLDEGRVEVDTDYTGLDLKPLAGIPSPQICNEKCKAEPLCFAWSWTSRAAVSEDPYQCFLKYYLPKTRSKSASAHGLISGMPNWHDPTWGLLFCFSVASPDPARGDMALLKAQADIRHGVFACDEQSVYSNKEVELVPGAFTTVVDHDFKCDRGGLFYECLNTGAYIAVWKHVFAEGQYLHFDWTVKVEPDTVFIAARLRTFLGSSYYQNVGIAYINNCQNGLHSALEVFSRGAIQAFAVLGPVCFSGTHRLKYDSWGEALFIDQCLGKVLQVPRVDGYGLLSEDRCGSTDWQDCSDISVAFHPFKTPGAYLQCAQKADLRGDVENEFYRKRKRRLSSSDVLV